MQIINLVLFSLAHSLPLSLFSFHPLYSHHVIPLPPSIHPSLHSSLHLLSSSSCCDQSDCPDFSGSVSADDNHPPFRRRPTHLSMTRLDPPPHRPNPRAWMEEAQSKDKFGNRNSGERGRETTCKVRLRDVTRHLGNKVLPPSWGKMELSPFVSA